jgi:hypothetical protein
MVKILEDMTGRAFDCSEGRDEKILNFGGDRFVNRRLEKL